MREGVQAVYSAERDHWWFRARRTIFAALLDAHVSRSGRARILDLGPGFGVNAQVFAGRGRWIALDVSDASLRACRSEGALAVNSDAARPGLAAESIDLVCALDVLEHLDDDSLALAEWRRVTRRGGRLLVSVPAFNLLWGRQDVLSEHRRRYRRAELRARVEAAGFRVLRISYFNTLLFAPIAATRLLMRPFLARSVRSGESDLSLRVPLVDRVLGSIFAAEKRWLVSRDLPFGVSLLCLAERPLEGPSTT